MQFKEWFLREDFQQWSGRWIHYSRSPYMKINPKMMWNDPFGIYFFPEKFEMTTQGQWHTFPYKFIVEFPSDMRVLDFSKITESDAERMLALIGAKPRKKTHRELTPAEQFWDGVESHFRDERSGSAEKGKMNAYLRKTLGYDAIFDDTNTVYHGETQLILLNPRVKYRVVDVVRRSGVGWNEFSQTIQHLAKLCERYGAVKVSKFKREFSGWSSEYQIKASVTVNEDKHREGPYCYWELYTNRVEHGRPEEIHCHLSWSVPDLPERRNMTIGTTVYLRKMDFSELDKLVTETMSRIWSREREAA